MKTQEHILSVLKNKYPELSRLGVCRIGLYGSYVKGDASENSDIDIIIDFVPEKETFDNYMLAYDIIENLFKENKVDLVTMNGLSPHIGPKILKDVKYVQGLT